MDARIEKNIRSLLSLRELLICISSNPGDYVQNQELINSLKSQGALAKLAVPESGITASSINTQKRISETTFNGGYEELDKLRTAAYEAIENKINEINRPNKASKNSLRSSIDQLKLNNQSLREDLLLLTMALEKALNQGIRYAEQANPSIVALCKKEQRELLDTLTLRKHVFNTNVVNLSDE